MYVCVVCVCVCVSICLFESVSVCVCLCVCMSTCVCVVYMVYVCVSVCVSEHLSLCGAEEALSERVKQMKYWTCLYDWLGNSQVKNQHLRPLGNCQNLPTQVRLRIGTTFVWSDVTNINGGCNYECLGRIHQCVKELAMSTAFSFRIFIAGDCSPMKSPAETNLLLPPMLYMINTEVPGHGNSWYPRPACMQATWCQLFCTCMFAAS